MLLVIYLQKVIYHRWCLTLRIHTKSGFAYRCPILGTEMQKCLRISPFYYSVFVQPNTYSFTVFLKRLQVQNSTLKKKRTQKKPTKQKTHKTKNQNFTRLERKNFWIFDISISEICSLSVYKWTKKMLFCI